MNHPYIFALYAAALVLAVGIILLLAYKIVKETLIHIFFNAMKAKLMPEIRNTGTEIMEKSLDMIPGKLLRAKKTMTEEE